MADNNQRLHEVCTALFAKKMPGNTPTVFDDHIAQRLLVGHPPTRTVFAIRRMMAKTDGSQKYLRVSLFEKRGSEFGECFAVDELLDGQKKFHPAAWWQDPKFEVPSPERYPNAGDRLIKLLRESMPLVSPVKCYWGVVVKRRITEVIAFVNAEPASGEEDERPGFYHLVRQGVKSQIAQFTSGGTFFKTEDFWKLVASNKLVDLDSLWKGHKRRWCQEPNALVLDDVLLAEPKTWEQQPLLALTDLKGLVKLP